VVPSPSPLPLVSAGSSVSMVGAAHRVSDAVGAIDIGGPALNDQGAYWERPTCRADATRLRRVSRRWRWRCRVGARSAARPPAESGAAGRCVGPTESMPR
jgi:hypothetical protein